MTAARILLAAFAALAVGFLQGGGCGFRDDPLKGVGEPCTRTSECEVGLTCRGGACSDASDPDAGLPPDGGARDASTPDAAPDASELLDAMPAADAGS